MALPLMVALLIKYQETPYEGPCPAGYTMNMPRPSGDEWFP